MWEMMNPTDRRVPVSSRAVSLVRRNGGEPCRYALRSAKAFWSGVCFSHDVWCWGGR
jgi:hypothetical protein